MERSFRRYLTLHGKVRGLTDVVSRVAGGADRRDGCRALGETRPDSQACATTLRRSIEVTVDRHQQLQTHTAGAVEDYA